MGPFSFLQGEGVGCHRGLWGTACCGLVRAAPVDILLPFLLLLLPSPHTSPSYPSPSPPLSSSSPSFSSHLSFTPLLLHPSRLLAHAHDPDLDKNTSREFIVYACPSGSLGTQIEDFMETALYQFGRNGSHKSIPHVTLCQFFKV